MSAYDPTAELLGTFIGFLVAVVAVWAVPIAVKGARLQRATVREELRYTPLRRFLPLVVLLTVSTRCAVPAALLDALYAASFVLVFAELALAGALVPLGLVRASHLLTRLAGYRVMRRSQRVGAAFNAARALVRRPTEEGARFVEAGLARDSELAPRGVAALGLVALARGEEERAHAIFRAIAAVPPELTSGDATSVAREYLALDAASRGAWAEVSDLAELTPRSRLTRLLHAVAARIRGDARPPGALGMLARWLAAPHRRSTRPLLGRVRADPADPVASVEPTFAAHGALARRAPHRERPADVVAAVLSLDAIRRSPRFLADIERRVAALGSRTEPRAVRDRLVQDAERDLVDLILEGHHPVAWLPAGESGDSIREQVRAERLRLVEDLAVEIHRRSREEKDLPEPDEYVAFGDLSVAIDEVLRDASTKAHRHSLFHAVHRPLWSYGYRLAFVRSKRTLARAVFARQRDLARAAEALDTYETIDGNLKAAWQDWSPRLPPTTGERLSRDVAARRVAAAAIAASGLLTAGTVAAEVAVRGRPVPVLGVLVPLFVFLAPVFYAAAGVTELVRTENGFVLQRAGMRYLIRPEDGVHARAGRHGFLFIRLERTPWWLPRRAWCKVASQAVAEALAAELRAVSASPDPGRGENQRRERDSNPR